MNSINTHYSRPGLLDRIDAALRASGKDPAHITPDDLAGVDQFHIGGKSSTLKLAAKAAPKEGQRILDIGGGLGGPARLLARDFGCQVTVLDLMEEFCAVGRELARRCGLADQVTFVNGNAPELPFDSGTFDLVWSQHSTMNIPDKAKLYSEIARVLHPHGRYVFHEAFAGNNSPVLFPTPWASDSNSSYMIPAAEAGTELVDAGLWELMWEDTTDANAAWVAKSLESLSRKGRPTLGVHLVLGEVFEPAFANLLTNLQQQRLQMVEAIHALASAAQGGFPTMQPPVILKG